MKFKSMKEFTTTDWGKAAATGILAGGLSGLGGVGVVWQILLDAAGLIGWISLVVWIYRTAKKI